MASKRQFGIGFIGKIDEKFYEKSNEHGPKLLWLVFFWANHTFMEGSPDKTHTKMEVFFR